MKAHNKVGGMPVHLQDLDDHVRSSSEEYSAKGGDVVGEIDGEIHPKMEKMKTCYWF